MLQVQRSNLEFTQAVCTLPLSSAGQLLSVVQSPASLVLYLSLGYVSILCVRTASFQQRSRVLSQFCLSLPLKW